MKISAVNFSTARKHLKDFCDAVYSNNDTLIVTRKDDENIVLISQDEFNRLRREAANAKYLAMLNESLRQLAEGDIVIKSPEELGIEI